MNLSIESIINSPADEIEIEKLGSDETERQIFECCNVALERKTKQTNEMEYNERVYTCGAETLVMTT